MPGMLTPFPSPVLGRFFDNTAVIKSIPAGDDDTARTTIIASLACTAPQSLNQEDKERAALGSVTRLLRSHVEVTATAITNRYRFVHGGVDYRIRAITAVPDSSPFFYELLLEDEGVSA